MIGGEIRLHWADYLVIVVCLVVALGIGVFFAFTGQKTKESYLMGNRQLSLVSVCLSLFVTFQSAISLVGIPAETYNTGTMALFIFVSLALMYVLAYFTTVPLFYPLRLTSVYSYLQLRLASPSFRYFITILGMIQTSLYMGVVLYSPALVLQVVAGLSFWVSVVLVGVVGIIYTAIGGIRSVVWTDVFQSVIIFIGLITAIIKGLVRVGGFSQMVEIASDGGRIIFDEVQLSKRHSYWSTMIGAGVYWSCLLVNQAFVQRVSALPSLQQAKWCALLNAPLHLVLGLVLCLVGILLYTYFVATGCDPYAAGYITNKNQVAPYFVLHVLRDLPGMPGLYLSMLFSGTLSTLSSGISAMATNTVEDLLARPLRGFKDTSVTVVAKVTVLVFGCLSLGMAYTMKSLSGSVSQLTISVVGAFGSPVLGVFVLAAALPRCNIYGAWGGIVVGGAVSVMMVIGSRLYGHPIPSLPPGPVDRCDVTNGSGTLPVAWNVTERVVMPMSTTIAPDIDKEREFTVWDVSYLWFPVIGFCTCVVVGIIVSFLTGCRKEAEEVDPRLIFPFCRRLYGLPDPPDSATAKERKATGLKTSVDVKTHQEDNTDERLSML